VRISISINELKILCQLFDVDNYWFVSSDEREVFNENYPTLSVGSITDDIQSLKKILDKTNPSIALGEKIYPASQ